MRLMSNIGGQLSQLLNIPFLNNSENMSLRSQPIPYLDRLRSNPEFMKSPPNSFVSQEMLDSLTFPKNLSPCIRFSEKLANTVLVYDSSAKKSRLERLRLFIMLIVAIITGTLIEITLLATTSRTSTILLSTLIILLLLLLIVLLLALCALIWIRYIIKPHEISLSIGHRNITLIHSPFFLNPAIFF